MTSSKTPVFEPQFFYLAAINTTSKISFSFSKGLTLESLRCVISGNDDDNDDDDDDDGSKETCSHLAAFST